MKKKKENIYKLNDKCKQLWIKYLSYTALRRLYVEKRFAHKKAVKCSYRAEKYRNEFWVCVSSLYPFLDKSKLEYSEYYNSIKVKGK